jgi:hypothetical protein
MDCLLYDFHTRTTKSFFDLFKQGDFLFPVFCISFFIFFWVFINFLINCYKKKQTSKIDLFVFGGITLFLFLANLFATYQLENHYKKYENFYDTQYFNITEGIVHNCRYYKRDGMNKLSRTQIVFEIKDEEFIFSENSFGKKKYLELSVIKNGKKLKICHLGNFIFTIEDLDCNKY